MKIVGIDASTKVTALALIEDGKLVHHCSIDFSKEKDVDTRIDGILKEADKILKSWDAHVVFVESPWMGNNIQTAMKLVYVIGGIRHICIETGAGFNLILPSEWRRVIGLPSGKKKREELKREALDYIEKVYDLVVGEDEAEAICICEAANELTDGGKVFE